jgi:hypothetical protein
MFILYCAEEANEFIDQIEYPIASTRGWIERRYGRELAQA